MQTNVRKRDPLKPKTSDVRSRDEIKKRKIPYRVGYRWNIGGRLKELRIRHLARKFLKIWIQTTFGRVHPDNARSHHNRVVLLRAFEGWRDEWWTSRKEWSLTVRAECHYRYYLYNRIFHSWQKFLTLQREKKKKVQSAQSFADGQRMHLAWDKWEVFVEMRRMKRRMLESALQQKRITTLRSVWNLWQTNLQQRHDFYAFEDQALQHWALTLQSRAWFQWKEMHKAACSKREKESKASLHFSRGLRRRALFQWRSYVSCRQNKKKPQAVAVHARGLRLVRMCWRKWHSGLHRKQSEEDQRQAAERLAELTMQRRTLEHWRTYVKLCREEAERNHRAIQHHNHHLLRAGLRRLSLNVSGSKAHQLNKIVAVQNYRQTITNRHWKLWQNRLEEAEDEIILPLIETALTHYSTSLLNSCFHHWKGKLAEHIDIKGLENRADAWFAEHMLPQRLNSWVEFTLQRRLQKTRREKAEVYNQQRQQAWVFYTWWEQSEKQKEQRLSERMAILHEERWRLHSTWSLWRQRTQQQIDESEKQRVSDKLYMHGLLQKTIKQWRDNSTEIQDRRKREKQACHQGDLRCMRWALDGWQQFAQSQRVKNNRLEQMRYYYEVKLLKQALQAWKEHHLHTAQVYGHAEELHRLQEQCFLRRVLAVWRENTVLLAEARVTEQRAQNHFQRCLQIKVFLAWRGATTRAASKRLQQGEVLTKAQSLINQVRLQETFRQWRKRMRQTLKERRDMERAAQHHHSKLLSGALKAWNRHHDQYQKYEVMKREGVLLLRLKTGQRYFERWKIELQDRRRETKQTERALWHWSLSLQAKVLCSWRLWITEKHRKRERLARAAQFYRDQLLREGVAYTLIHTSHMKSLTSSRAQHSQEQSSQHLQRVVQRCAMRWKQQALCKPGRVKEVREGPPKKRVSFCLPTPGSESVSHGFSWSDSAEQRAEDGVLRKLFLTRTSRLQPRRSRELLDSPVKVLQHDGQPVVTSSHPLTVPHPLGLSSPLHKGCTQVSSCLQPHTVHISSRPVTQSTNVSAVGCSETHMSSVDSPHGLQNQDVLLPPSSFMTTTTQTKLGQVSNSSPKDTTRVPPHQFTLPFNQQSTTDSGVRLRASSEEAGVHTVEEEPVEAEADPTSALTEELLSIRMDMKCFQQDRKQLQAWERLREVLKTWLQTSGPEEQIEKSSVCQELKELEECINRLSSEVAKRKPQMFLHAARVQHLQTLLTSGVDFTSRTPEERRTDQSALTT